MKVGGQNMDRDPVRIGRINIKVEKALGYDFGEARPIPALFFCNT